MSANFLSAKKNKIVGLREDIAMRLKASVLSMLALAAVQLTSCQRSAPFDPAMAGAFFPLRPGSSWTYHLIDKAHHATTVFTDRAVGKERIAAPEAAGAVVSEYSSPGGTGKSTITYVAEHGYITRSLSIGDNGWTAFEEREFLPQLLKPDLTWSNSLRPFESEPESFHVTQTHRTFLESEVVAVPAGRFSRCIRIETDALYQDDASKMISPRRVRYIDWYAPDVGLVKTLVMEPGFFGSEIARVELVNFANSQIKTAAHLSKAE